MIHYFSLVKGTILLVAGITIISCNSTNTQYHSQNDTASNVSMDSAKMLNQNRFDSSGSAMQNAQYMASAYAGGLFEIKASQEAMKRSSNQKVTALAQYLHESYSKLNKTIESLSAPKQIALPGNETREEQQNLNVLRGKHGAEFDIAYIMQVINHLKANVVLLQKAQLSNDPDVIQWAKKTLPTVQKDLDLAGSYQNTADTLLKKQSNL